MFLLLRRIYISSHHHLTSQTLLDVPQDLQRRQQEQFLARRQALLQYQQQHRHDPNLRGFTFLHPLPPSLSHSRRADPRPLASASPTERYYASSSTRYAPPLTAYGRSPYTSGGYYSRRGNYGYGGGYGGMGMGMPLMMGGLGGLGAGMMVRSFRSGS